MKIELPTALGGWQVKPVGEVFDINSETLPNSTAADFQFRYIPLESVYPEQIDFASVQQIRFGEAPSRARRVIKRGDILISTVRPNLQGFAEFQPPDDGPYVCSTGFAALRPKNGHDQQFYLQQLLSDFGASQFCAYVTGTNYPAISDRDFARLKLLVPEDGLERETASVLRKISAAIARTWESIAKAEQLQKGLMQQLLTGRLKPDGTPRSKSELQDTKLGPLPKHWRLIKGKDCCVRVTDGTHDTPKPANQGHPLLTSKNLTGDGIDLSDAYLISKEDFDAANQRSKVDQFDVLYGMIGTIGNPEIVEEADVQFAAKNVGIFKTGGNRVLAVWLRNYLRSPMYLLYLHRQQAGTTQQFISLGYLRKLPVPFPVTSDAQIDWDEVITISTWLQTVENLRRAKRAKIAALQRLKKSLMQNLLTGRIRVPVDTEVVKHAA
jgi:type I restriction enzyme S subunit